MERTSVTGPVFDTHRPRRRRDRQAGRRPRPQGRRRGDLPRTDRGRRRRRLAPGWRWRSASSAARTARWPSPSAPTTRPRCTTTPRWSRGWSCGTASRARATCCPATAGSSRAATAPPTSASASSTPRAAFQHIDYKDSMRRWLANTDPELGFRDENLVGGRSARPRCRWASTASRTTPAACCSSATPAAWSTRSTARASTTRSRPVTWPPRPRCRRSPATQGPARERVLAGLRRALDAEYGGYFTLGRGFAKLIGNPTFMKLATKHGLPRPALMRFTLKLMANLTDHKGGDAHDRIINALADGIRAGRIDWAETTEKGGAAMELYTPVLALVAIAAGFAIFSVVDERARRAEALQPGEARLLRVRHRADAAAGRRRPLPGQVLHRRDALHRLRHRDRLPLPVGRLLRLRWRSSGSSRWSCSSPRCSSPTPTSGVAADWTGTEGRTWVSKRSSPAGVLLTTVEGVAGYMRKASFWPATFGLACCAIEMMTHRRPALRPRPLRHGGLPRLAAPGRPDDRRRPGQPEDGAGAPPDLRPDARARSGSSRWASARAAAGCSTTTRSSRASTTSSPSTCTSPAARRGPEMLIDAILKLHDQVQHAKLGANRARPRSSSSRPRRSTRCPPRR